jgi:hypothetical protein
VSHWQTRLPRGLFVLHRCTKTSVTQFVTEAQAEAILAELCPSRQDRPLIDQFRDQVEATVEPIWAIYCAAGHYRAVDMALRKLRLSTEGAKTALRAMEESSKSPKMLNYTDLLKLDEVRTARLVVNEVHWGLARVPAVFSGQQKPGKGPAPRSWYSRFARDLAEIADEIGIELTIGGGGRTDDAHATPFTRFVFAVERFLPRKAQSNSLTACAKRIERAVEAFAHEIGVEQAFIAHARKGERAFKAYLREIGKKSGAK